MDDFINIDSTFEKVIRMDAKITGREFDGCTFVHCDFSNTVFTDCSFIDCTFNGCNLSMAKFPQTGLKTVTFKDCKLLGIRFDEADPFLFAIAAFDSTLDYSWFTGRKMPKTIFSNCSLKGVNFTGADLTSSDFSGCNLDGAVFDNTILKSADFSAAFHYKIDPQFNPMEKAKFSVDGLSGLLEKYDIRIDHL